MSTHKFHHHFVVHLHENGRQHRAHAISLFSLFALLNLLVLFSASFFALRTYAPQILGVAKYAASDIVKLTNDKRVEAGLSQLQSNDFLNKAAYAKAQDMLADDYWAHNSPSGKTPWSFISGSGYRYIYAGENLARDFEVAQDAVNAWMASSSHRSNLLDKNYRDIGVAVVSGDLAGSEVILVVQMFGAGPSQYLAGHSSIEAPVDEQAAARATEVQVLQEQNVEVTVLASRKFGIAKSVSLGLVGFIFVLFVLEVIVTLKHQHLRMRSTVVAHLAILGFVLLMLWYSTSGTIL